MAVIYSIGLELTILLTVWLCLGVWQKDRSTPGRTTFALLGLSACLWCMGEIAAQRELLTELWADRVRYLGILSLPPLWVGLAGHAARLELARRVPWFPALLLAPMTFLYAVHFSPNWGGLFFVTVPGEVDRYGPLWWIATCYSYTLVATGSCLLVYSALRWEVPGRWSRRVAVGLAPIAPLAGNAIYVAAGLSGQYDPTPLLFSVALVALRSAIFTGGLLEALPISQHDLIEQLPLGVILTDRRSVVIDVNPAAEARLGISEAKAVGRALDAVLAEAGEEVCAEVAPIYSNDREAGQLVLIDPPGKD